MKKRIDRAFGKAVYLLGEDSNGVTYWLEEPKWDCSWYWGFGYVETYQTFHGRVCNSPHNAHDCASHNHFDGMFWRRQDKKVYLEAWKATFVESTLTDKEVWTLMELMKAFYTLKETAELYYNGSAHVTTNPCKELLQNANEYERLNKKVIPELFKEVAKLLAPETMFSDEEE